jgi:hypothetical protein
MFRSIATVLIACLFVSALPQDKSGYGEMHLKSKLGSFKILKFNWQSPAVGRIEIKFSGTLLVSDYQGAPIEPTIKGNIKKEFPDPKALPQLASVANKLVYHGTGSLVLDGKFMGVQWFGRDMEAKWVGAGVIRLFGEFDDQGKTGTFYYANRPEEVRPWPTPMGSYNNPAALSAASGPLKKPVLGAPKTTPKPQNPPKKGGEKPKVKKP